MTSKDHFPWPHNVAQQWTIFYFYIITSIKNSIINSKQHIQFTALHKNELPTNQWNEFS